MLYKPEYLLIEKLRNYRLLFVEFTKPAERAAIPQFPNLIYNQFK